MEGNGRGACGGVPRGQQALLIREHAPRFSRTFGTQNIIEGWFANLPNSYAMMSKTAVHHYTGTNVSYPPFRDEILRVGQHRLLLVTPGWGNPVSPAYPEKKSRCRLWRVPVRMLTLPLDRLSSAPPAESSSAAPPWPFWTLVTVTSSASRLRSSGEAGIPVGIHTAFGSEIGKNDMTTWRYPAFHSHIRHPEFAPKEALCRLVVVYDNAVSRLWVFFVI
jgi:hypothetical protein